MSTVAASVRESNPDRADGHPGPSPRRRAWTWAALTAAALVVLALLPLLADTRFYFRGDTQVAYNGWWYEFGHQLRAGHWPLLDPLRWESGNYVAEGQWGLFSPLTIVIGLVATVVPNVVVFTTAVKAAFVLVGGLGMFVLLRDYRVGPRAAAIGGVLVGLSSQSVFLDWPSWVNGQMAVALLPWAWWTTRRTARGANPFSALALGYLVVTIGYVYAALYLAIVLVGCLVDTAWARDLRATLRVLVVGVVCGLVTLTVYLPGVLTAPVTVRAAWAVVDNGTMTVSVGSLLTSMIPLGQTAYLLWVLPVVAWVDLRRLSGAFAPLAGAFVSLTLMLLWVLGPAQVGPIRWPARVLPALMVPLVVVLVVVAARALSRRPGRRRVALSLAWVLGAGYVLVSRDWVDRRDIALGTLLVCVLVVVLALAVRRSLDLAAATAVLGTIVVLAAQLASGMLPPALDRHMPASATAYRTQIPDTRGDVAVLGAPDYYAESAMVRNPDLARQLLVAASWYRNPASVQNAYTTISFTEFRDRFCRRYNGDTCAAALPALLAEEPTTGRRWVDLLSTSTLVFYRPSFAPAKLADPPDGWHVAGQTRWTLTWVRDEPVPTAGGVVWTSPGSDVDQDRTSAREVRLRVRDVPSDGATVVLSRLTWPGYRIEGGGTLGTPLDDILLTVRLSPADAGRTLTLTWDPPGWDAERAAWVLAVLGGLAWSVAAGARQWRTRKTNVR